VSFLAWMALAGGVMLLMALSSAYLRNLPISTSAIYPMLGVALDPWGWACFGSTCETSSPGSSG